MSPDDNWSATSLLITEILMEISRQVVREERLSEEQLRMIDYFLFKGRLSGKAVVLLQRSLGAHNWHRQVKERVKAYFVPVTLEDLKDANSDLDAEIIQVFLKEIIEDPQFTDEDIISSGQLDPKPLKMFYSGLLCKAFKMSRVKVSQHLSQALFEVAALSELSDIYWELREIIKSVATFDRKKKKITYETLNQAQIDMFFCLFDELSSSSYGAELWLLVRWYFKDLSGHPQIGRRYSVIMDVQAN